MKAHNLMYINKIAQRNVGVGGLSLPLPCFFPSISCVKTNLSCTEYLRLLVALKYPLFLISAYDIYYANSNEVNEIKKLLKTAINNKQIVLIDSGNYESFWLQNKQWNSKKFEAVLRIVPHQLAFCYDYVARTGKIKKIVTNIEKLVSKNQLASKGTIIPIVHASKDLLPDIISELVDRVNPLFIAVPERLLGEGIMARAKTIIKIRKTLAPKKQYYPLHLLGTGNPLSILIYSICGADSFDGLEWCQTTVDYNTGLLYHFQQREFFNLPRNLRTILTFPYNQATLVYNLQFYKTWVHKIQECISRNVIKEPIYKYIPYRFKKLLNQQLKHFIQK